MHSHSAHHHHDHSHAHGHAHGHAGHHHHHVGSSSTKLLWALALTLSFAAVEAFAGWISGSLALLGDAGHMVTDSMSLGLAAGAALLAKRAPSHRHSYGLGRLEILAALFNAFSMLVIVLWISVEAIERFKHPQPVEGGLVMLVAGIGLLINLGAAWLLSGHGHDLNVRGALLHVLGDLLGSVAALISGAVILATGWTPIDPLLSLLIVVLVAVSAVRLLREALHALMEGVPLHLDLQKVGYGMAEVDGVFSVHDLHIWSVSSSEVALSAHVVLQDMRSWPAILAELQQQLHEQFGITHVTLQPELNEKQVGVDQLRDADGLSTDHS